MAGGARHRVIRRLGAILLAKELAAFPDLVGKIPRVIAYQGPSKLSTPLIDRSAKKGYAIGGWSAS